MTIANTAMKIWYSCVICNIMSCFPPLLILFKFCLCSPCIVGYWGNLKKVHYVVKVVEVDSASAVMKTKVQIPSISAMNNFQFEESGVRVWKHYKLGPGKIKVYRNWVFFIVSTPKCNVFFRSPGPQGHVTYCHHLASSVRPHHRQCRCCLLTFTKNLLLWNYLANWNQT